MHNLLTDMLLCSLFLFFYFSTSYVVNKDEYIEYAINVFIYT